ncbi:glycine betaine/L-proline transporter ProP [Paraburkholderia caballeronis]|uniref:MFS transporter, MHS family, proline/betaine transporter n=1 Tax=Paraburkholderia caballeronis TaxID=416943 RepID=A0A1H7MZA0_9BURK|nr:glycine betaine/L-proline transporter ProP [Paraburkholderia caballeronis]PXW26335.1 MHS family proline/betaine transporter-like MFS transporter [Paraburkholderia caballeronis]PXX01882.1 MHS family proline/betaine transporter-like MFS transporter [Paraburkholderia caballeronis]RAK01039.1 MHS family proline/betaine transporter-like MFS transporter [Paraburkholderia caballeronis]SEC01401.1 MFS transporter, MHS family, proline/betaine transporter [Paraburkholderia caballeronis]SEL16656.1 MFS t
MTASRTGSQPEPLTLDDITIVDRSLLKRAVGAMALGNAMEWFDFGVYSYIAVTLGKVFFPSSSPSAQLIATFGTFAAAFLVRPVGGMVFGPLGDRIGRQRVLAMTMILMACGTFAIGLIPSYASIGFAAPLLLLAARLVQGFSTGGEYGGAATFIAEFATDKRRGFMGSFLEFGTLIGYVLGAGTVALLTATLSETALLDWGWRVPFLIAGPLGLVGLYIRMKLEETPAFRREAEAREAADHALPKPTLRALFTEQLRPLLLCVGLVLVFNVTDYMALSYLPGYLSATLHFNETHGLFLVLLVMVLMMPMTLGFGHLSDLIGRKPVMLAGCVGLIALSAPALLLIQTGSLLPVFFGILMLGALLSCFTGAMPSALPALFPTPVRYGALAIGFNVSVSLFGGTTPLVAAWLVETTHDLMMPAYYLMGAAAIGLVTVLALRETARRPLPGSAPCVGTKAEAHAVLRGARVARELDDDYANAAVRV